MNDEFLTNLVRMIDDLLQKRSSKIKHTQIDDQPLTNKDLAVFLNVSTRTLHAWRKDHGLKAVYLSNRIYYYKKDVVEYLQSNRH